MDQLPSASTDGSACLARKWRLLTPAAIIGLCAWHAWLTYSLFGPADVWARLTDDRPIVSGSHPLHLYHGYLGAKSLRERGTALCYDPSFQAGYPKTPLFDSGSRPAELFLTLAGGSYIPAAYKIGVAACCLGLPFIMLLAARGMGQGWPGVFFTMLMGFAIWWGSACQRLLRAGDLDVLLGGLAVMAHGSTLIAFHRSQRIVWWVGLVLTAALAWFSLPLLLVAFVPLFLVYYLSVGSKHSFFWHACLLAGLAAGLVMNLPWLADLVSFWWVRAEPGDALPFLQHRTLRTVWEWPDWGGPLDRVMAGAILTLGMVGVVIWNQTSRRPQARMAALGSLAYLALALAGLVWEPLAVFSTPHWFVVGLWFAVLPAAQTVHSGMDFVCRALGGPMRTVLAASTVAGAAGYFFEDSWRPLLGRYRVPEALVIGLDETERSLVAELSDRTSRDARILWEEWTPPGQESATWLVLLPVLTDRYYLGGLDLSGGIEHCFARLGDACLAGRPIKSSTDAELDEFCRRFNVGWIVSTSENTRARLEAWPAAVLAARLAGGACLWQTPYRSYALHGTARLIRADSGHLVFADVIPQDDKVILSMHYQAGMRVSPGHVQLEREPDPSDPIPFVRLRMANPVARLTITWQPR